MEISKMSEKEIRKYKFEILKKLWKGKRIGELLNE